MTPDLDALGRRAVACRAWKWAPGMRGVLPDTPKWCGRVMSVGGAGKPWWSVSELRGPWPKDALPDLSDAATLGCLLALVREAWDEPELYVRSSRDDESWIVCAADHEGRERLMVLRSDPYRASEAEALVVALEAAPESARRPGDGAR